MKWNGWMMAAALSAGVCSTSFAQVAGTVTLDGEPPEPAVIEAIKQNKACAAIHEEDVYADNVVVGENGELANVVVSVKAEAGQLPGAAPKEPVVLDQSGCMYRPHVLALMVGQPIVVKNSDEFMHNVHTLPIENDQENIAQPTVDPGRPLKPLKVAERFKVKCDVHPWMEAHINVFPHPYFAVSGEDGAFTLPKGLPAGKYTLEAWHELFGTQEQQITVDANGKTAEPVEFTFTAEAAEGEEEEAALAEPAQTNVKLAVAEAKAAGKDGKDCEGKACCATKKGVKKAEVAAADKAQAGETK